MKPSVADTVHYVQPGDEDKGQEVDCLAALVTDSDGETTADLVIWDKRGQRSFRSGVPGDRGSEGAETWHAAGMCPYDN
jgi:hypothetical protein